MLAEQLVKELAAGAASGAIVVGGTDIVDRAEVLVRIVAGDPTPDDEQLVRAADARGTPVVVVQLWPQADWTMPFVLTPFVVECRAGEGFPVSEIADRIVEATESSAVLASRAPVIEEATRGRLVKSAVLRSALIGLVGARLGVSRSLSDPRAGPHAVAAPDGVRRIGGGRRAARPRGRCGRDAGRRIRVSRSRALGSALSCRLRSLMQPSRPRAPG